MKNKTNEYINFWCDWTQIPHRQFNWISFTFIHLYFEWDRMFNQIELEIGLIGLNLRVQIPVGKPSPKILKEMKKWEKELKF